MYRIDEVMEMDETKLANQDVFADPKMARIAAKSRHYFCEALAKEFGCDPDKFYDYKMFQQHQMIELLKEQNMILQQQNTILQEQNNILKQQLIRKQPQQER